jgi:phosphate transport system substrate-binding protein
MKRGSIIFGIVLIGFFLVVFSCKENQRNEETILKGKTKILVDESLLPIIEDQVAVFENSYDAKIDVIAQSENENILALSKGVADIIILPRQLTNAEHIIFKKNKIKPRSTPFAKDAIALLRNIRSNDTLVAVEDLVSFLNNKPSSIRGLVFDNPNSSSVNYIKKIAGINNLPENNVFSFKTTEEVIKHIASNDGVIGVIGVNWIFQPSPNMEEYINKINVLNVKPIGSNDYVSPSQENIAIGKYPLARDLYIINCQGYEGLGMGFASFISGEKGQRIILKSGLVPVRIPGRNIRTRNQIETK